MWTSDISSMVFTRIKAEGTKALKTKYPDIYFTTSGKAQITPKFPTVYVQELGTPERNADLEGRFINSINAAFQIDVIDSQSQNRAKDVMNTVLDIMKKMSFKGGELPHPEDTGDTYRSVARFERKLDWNDIL